MVDAAGEHVRTAKLTDYLNDGRPIHVMRYKENDNLRPVLKSAEHYLELQEPYANSNLIMLGLVLLFNKTKPNSSLAKKALTKIINLVCAELMELLNKKLYPHKEPFVCSQFVAENFNQAQSYEPYQKYPMHYTLQKKQDLCLYELLFQAQNPDTMLLGSKTASNRVLGDKLDDLCVLLKKFIEIFDKEAKNNIQQAENAALANEEDTQTGSEFLSAVNSLAHVQYMLGNGVCDISLKEIMQYLKKLENYFVTPGNLLFDCISLKYVGTLFPNKC